VRAQRLLHICRESTYKPQKSLHRGILSHVGQRGGDGIIWEKRAEDEKRGLNFTYRSGLKTTTPAVHIRETIPIMPDLRIDEGSGRNSEIMD